MAALKSNGSVVTWGNYITGGTVSESIQSELNDTGSSIKHIYSSKEAFAALKTDGSVIAWGNSSNGGNTSSNNSGWETNLGIGFYW